MGEDDLIRRGDALRAIDPGHGDFHAGNYNAIAALPVVDKAATIARLPRELAEMREAISEMHDLASSHAARADRAEAERDALIGAAWLDAEQAWMAYFQRCRAARDADPEALTYDPGPRPRPPAEAAAALDKTKADARAEGFKAGRDAVVSELDRDVADRESDASRFRGGSDPHHYRMTIAQAVKHHAENCRRLTPPDDPAIIAAAAQEAGNI